MEIEWIGTGSGLNAELGNTSFVVKGENNRLLLVDCGFTVPSALVKNRLISKITDIVITHAHADHIGGLESFGFMHYFAFKNRGDKRPNLHLASDEFAHCLWQNSLKGGMGKMQSDDNKPVEASLETFFKLHIGKTISTKDFPKIILFETLHVQGLENYGLIFPKAGMLYSGDTIEKPRTGFEIIFQDCQFFETPSDVHISYDKLLRSIEAPIRNKIWLVHLGSGYDKKKCAWRRFCWLRVAESKIQFLDKIKQLQRHPDFIILMPFFVFVFSNNFTC